MKIIKKIMGVMLAALAFLGEVVAIGIMLTGIILCVVTGLFAIAHGNAGVLIISLLVAAGLFIILLEASK